MGVSGSEVVEKAMSMSVIHGGWSIQMVQLDEGCPTSCAPVATDSGPSHSKLPGDQAEGGFWRKVNMKDPLCSCGDWGHFGAQ